jgi:hypothetical protein
LNLTDIRADADGARVTDEIGAGGFLKPAA